MRSAHLIHRAESKAARRERALRSLSNARYELSATVDVGPCWIGHADEQALGSAHAGGEHAARINSRTETFIARGDDHPVDTPETWNRGIEDEIGIEAVGPGGIPVVVFELRRRFGGG